MEKFIDMTGWVMSEHGVTYSRIIVIQYIGNSKWLVKCNCGNEKQWVVSGQNVRNGHTKSCGCIHKEAVTELCKQRHKINKYDLSGDYGIGYCSNTNRQFMFDLEDYDKIKDYCWYESRLSRKYHAVEAHIPDSGKGIKLHQLILGPHADHINRDPMDNRKENLRICSKEENHFNTSIRSDNTSGFIGVSWDKRKKHWRVRVSVNNKEIYLGGYNNLQDAIKARLYSELKYFGAEFAPQRHLFEQYGITQQNNEEVAI